MEERRRGLRDAKDGSSRTKVWYDGQPLLDRYKHERCKVVRQVLGRGIVGYAGIHSVQLFLFGLRFGKSDAAAFRYR